MIAEQVFIDIAQERDRQKIKYPGDASLTPLDWHEMLSDYNGMARRMSCQGRVQEARRRFVQLAAMAVCAIDVIDAARNTPKEPTP
jgi:environmental stress-induced protein Ves